MSSILCTAWQNQVKEFFTQLHGHQSKTLALFVFGAIQAKSIVIPLVAEALLAESEAKASSIERRLERFLSNERVHTEETWNTLLEQIMPYFRQRPMRLVIDLTPYEEHAQVIYIGILQHSRVLPLAWKVMPGQEKWDQGLWDCIEAFLVIPGALDVSKNEPPGSGSPCRPGLCPPIQPPNLLVLETRSSIRAEFAANHEH